MGFTEHKKKIVYEKVSVVKRLHEKSVEITD